MRAVHAHMHRLCRHTNVRYGPILCMHPLSMPPWMVPGLDWYGLDIYDWLEFRNSDGTLNINGALYPRLAQWRALGQLVMNVASRLCRQRIARCFRRQPEGFYYWEFRQSDGTGILGVRKAENEPFAVTLYNTIPPGDVTVYRGRA